MRVISGGQAAGYFGLREISGGSRVRAAGYFGLREISGCGLFRVTGRGLFRGGWLRVISGCGKFRGGRGVGVAGGEEWTLRVAGLRACRVGFRHKGAE